MKPKTGIRRRDFLKSAGIALAALTEYPSSFLSAFDISKLGTASALPARVIANVEHVSELAVHISFVDTDQIGCAKDARETVEFLSHFHSKLRQEVAGLENEVTPLQMSEIILRRREKIFNYKEDLTKPGTKRAFLALAKQAQQGIKYIQMAEGEFLNLLTQKAAQGYAKWTEIHINRGFPPHNSPAAPDTAPAKAAKEVTSETLEDILARDTVRVVQRGANVYIFSFDTPAIATLARGLKPLAENMGQNEYCLMFNPAPHTIRSLVRPYIKDYRSEPPER